MQILSEKVMETKPLNADQKVVLSVQNLNIAFGKANALKPAVKQVSFDIPEDEIVALVGESGSGKSVTSMAVMRLLPKHTTWIDSNSRILFEGKDLLKQSLSEMQQLRGKIVSMVFQEPMSSLNPVYTVGDQIIESLRLHQQLSKKAALAKAITLLKEVGLPDVEKRVHYFPHQLSGGQQQRVMIAMAISCNPKLLIADEPTTALDVTVQRQMIDLLLKLKKQHKMSILFITHDLGLVKEIADQVVVMQNGEIKETGRADTVFSQPQHPYTKALIACRPSIEFRPKRLPVVADFLNGHEPIHAEPRVRGVSSSDTIILEVKQLSKTFTQTVGLFQKQHVHAVKDISFKLPKGKTLGIVGESGSGKTTLGKSILRLIPASSGEVIYQNQNILNLSPDAFKAYQRNLQIVFQNPYASLNPRFTVGDILLEPMRIHHIGESQDERTEHALSLLKRVGLGEDAFNRYPHEFSGGQRQRIGIARCLTMKPEIIVCDESVSALDVSVQAQVLNLLTDLQDEFQLSYLFISHDLAVVRHISDEVLVMQHGQMVEYGDVEEIFFHPKEAYTQKLLAAIPGR